MRENLRVEVKRLGESLTPTRDEVGLLRVQVRKHREFNLHLIVSRAEAKAALNALDRLQSQAVTIWPVDSPPPEVPHDYG